MSEIRVNRVVAAEGTSAPTLPYGFQIPTGMGITGAGGVNVTGVVTATSFSGSGAALTGIAVTENVRTNTVTVSGVSTFTGNIDANGDIDVDGTANLDVIDVDGTANFAAVVTVADSTSSTSTTTGALVVTGGAGIGGDVYIGAGLSVAGTLTYEDVTNVDSVGLITAKSGVNISGGQLQVGVAYSVGAAGVCTAAGFVGPLTGAVTGNADTATSATTATLATNVTVSANNSTNETVYPLFVDGATGTQGAETDTGLTYNPSSGNLGIGGELAAATLDISGNADIDGTMEADAYTVNGTALNTYIAGITVTNATHILVTDNESTNENNLITFVENETSSTGQTGLEMDGNLTYNPSSGTVSATTFSGGLSGNLTGTVLTSAQANITSVGTLTGLTVSGDLFFDNGSDAGKDLLWDVSQDALIYKDSVYASFGTDQDMSIWFDGSNSYMQNTTGNLYIRPKSSEDGIRLVPDAQVDLYYNNSARLSTTNEGVNVSGMMSATAGIGITGGMFEGCYITAGKLSDNTNIDIADGNIWHYTTTETTTCTPNIRWNSTYSLANKVRAGSVVTLNVITTAAAAGYCANWTIDGSAVTEEWNGGSAPTAGGASGYDVYTHTIIHKPGGSWLVLSNVSNFA
jgi:cytoskeletal protein CcmA (bactofilin family)